MTDRQGMEEKTLEGVLNELVNKVVESSDPQRSLEVVLIILTQPMFGIPNRRRSKWKPLRI